MPLHRRAVTPVAYASMFSCPSVRLRWPVAWIETKIHQLAAQCATTDLTGPANFLGTWTPSTYALDCSSNMTSPLLEWRTQLM